MSFVKNLLIIFWGFVFSISVSAFEVKNEKAILEKLDDYNECQNRSYAGQICDTALRAWVDSHPADLFKAGKMTRAKMNAWGAIYFF